MNTAVVRAGIVNVPVRLWNLEVRTTGSCEKRLHGMQQQRLLPEAGSVKFCDCGVAFTSTTACDAPDSRTCRCSRCARR